MRAQQRKQSLYPTYLLPTDQVFKGAVDSLPGQSQEIDFLHS